MTIRYKRSIGYYVGARCHHTVVYLRTHPASRPCSRLTLLNEITCSLKHGEPI